MEDDDDIIAKHVAKAMKNGRCPTQEEVRVIVTIDVVTHGSNPHSVHEHTYYVPADQVENLVNDLLNETYKIGEKEYRGKGQEANPTSEEAQ